MNDVDQRVREIIDLMLGGEWHPGRVLELSERHGVTPVAVQDWSRQAGRFLRMCRGSSEEFRERLLANLDYAGRLALTLKRTWIGKDGEPFESEAPDVKAFIAAQVEQAKLLRLDQPDSPDDDGDEQQSVEQVAAALRALGHEVKLNVRSESEPATARANERKAEEGAAASEPVRPATKRRRRKDAGAADE